MREKLWLLVVGMTKKNKKTKNLLLYSWEFRFIVIGGFSLKFFMLLVRSMRCCWYWFLQSYQEEFSGVGWSQSAFEIVKKSSKKCFRPLLVRKKQTNLKQKNQNYKDYINLVRVGRQSTLQMASNCCQEHFYQLGVTPPY